MRQRTITYWDGSSETDYVCEHCETIVLVPASGCQWCKQTAEKTAARLLKLKGSQQLIEMSETDELQLF
jgi:hypothetical protein